VSQTILNELVALSHHLGEEWREYVIVGEGNTSARIDKQTFWIKTSGANLRTIDERGFVRLYLDRVLALIDQAQNDDDVTRGFSDAKVDPNVAARPSIETFIHALAIAYGGAQFAGHTHPVAVNAILCSQQAEMLTRHITPDGITVCGAHPAFVPYYDVGIALARATRDALQKNIAQYGEPPKVMYLQNHGMLVLGRTAIEIENVTAMAVKNARTMAQTFSLGGPRFFDENTIARIDKRPDEILRRKKFEVE
jgi:rhamnose utilization protein RhaD (predicted bifunctional aldolase and dehydrogenase)